MIDLREVGIIIQPADEEKIKAHCLRECRAQRRWAESRTSEWVANASDVSRQLLNDCLQRAIDDRVENMYNYWAWRAHARNGTLDPYARAGWDAVVAGNPAQGDHSYFQMEYPEPVNVDALMDVRASNTDAIPPGP